MGTDRVIGHAVGDIGDGEDMAVVPWKEWARLRLVEEKAREVYDLCFLDRSGEHYLVVADAIAELEAAFRGVRSDI